MSESKWKKTNEKIAQTLTEGFQKMEDGVVGGYKKIEDGVVGSYKKMEESVVGTYKKVEDAFVDKFLTREGESVEDAKKRIEEERAAMEHTGNGTDKKN